MDSRLLHDQELNELLVKFVCRWQRGHICNKIRIIDSVYNGYDIYIWYFIKFMTISSLCVCSDQRMTCVNSMFRKLILKTHQRPCIFQIMRYVFSVCNQYVSFLELFWSITVSDCIAISMICVDSCTRNFWKSLSLMDMYGRFSLGR